MGKIQEETSSDKVQIQKDLNRSDSINKGEISRDVTNDEKSSHLRFDYFWPIHIFGH